MQSNPYVGSVSFLKIGYSIVFYILRRVVISLTYIFHYNIFL